MGKIEEKPLKIIKFQAEHIKKIKAIEISPDPDENVVVLTGKNRQGKTSILDSIWCALGGKSSIPVSPIANGEESGLVVLDLGEFTVSRSFTDGGKSYLSIKNKDGFKMTSPQTFLSSKLGDYARDPLAFMRLRDDEQVKFLQGVVNIPFDQAKIQEVTGLFFGPECKDICDREDAIALLDIAHKKIYERRTEINRDVARLSGTVKTLAAAIPDGNENLETISAKSLLEERKVLEGQDKARKLVELQIQQGTIYFGENLTRKASDVAFEIADLESRLEAARAKLKSIEEERATTMKMVDGLKVKLDGMPIPDFSEIDSKISTVDQHNKQAEEAARLRESKKELLERDQASMECSEILSRIKAYRGELVAVAGLPVPGLGFESGVVTYNGVPLSQASGREQIEVSCAICFAQNPSIGVMTVDVGWSELDEDGKAVLKEWAKKMGAQIWVTKVAETPENEGFHIYDGEVIAVNGESAKEQKQ